MERNSYNLPGDKLVPRKDGGVEEQLSLFRTTPEIPAASTDPHAVDTEAETTETPAIADVPEEGEDALQRHWTHEHEEKEERVEAALRQAGVGKR